MQPGSALVVVPAIVIVLLALPASRREALAQGAVEEDLAIGLRILANETGGDPRKLLWWNAGESFASLGIGHFIWYPASSRGPFEESFPALLAYLAQSGVVLPAWLQTRAPPACPWADRAAFEGARESPRMRDLQALLASTIEEQAQFLTERLRRALPALLAHAPPALAPLVKARFERLQATPQGRYALVDYVNFKGEGTRESERYRGEGWGLLQVLLAMRDEGAPLDAFADAAVRTLSRRVRNAPPKRGEHKWLSGWTRRIDTYRTAP